MLPFSANYFGRSFMKNGLVWPPLMLCCQLGWRKKTRAGRAKRHSDDGSTAKWVRKPTLRGKSRALRTITLPERNVSSLPPQPAIWNKNTLLLASIKRTDYPGENALMKSFAEAKQNEKILQSKVPRESIHIYENNAKGSGTRSHDTSSFDYWRRPLLQG